MLHAVEAKFPIQFLRKASPKEGGDGRFFPVIVGVRSGYPEIVSVIVKLIRIVKVSPLYPRALENRPDVGDDWEIDVVASESYALIPFVFPAEEGDPRLVVVDEILRPDTGLVEV